ncbi:AraC family transcriptional regulator [Lactonifactor longoviformis]|uniref:AraC family transcriptional regulator n=1 Tax=Lactonifactor longoviformis DSM 17459 TaxID=1122155 RepID=A0A1M5A7I2_9CLOT|nr:AraC family transcriptional regulator [Lactonifactor longoviformis]POP30525.1 AraC family transcriptional regulator [Lactonifactor longoviformis]SHF26125.1 AraC family transcriptional regulator [Lactonifactor longoviformis DSM 17459]
MDWNDKLQRIIDYTEDHLQRKEEPVDMDEITRISGCSYHFFLKVFSYMNGISYAEYVRHRKLTLAGYDLKSSPIKVVDLSYKYGYDSPTSFTKAFQQFHGISPKEARGASARLQVLPRMQVYTRNKYSWRIEHKPSFRLIGKRASISCIAGSPQTEIPGFWNECQKNGIYSQIISLDTGKPKGLFGISEKYDEASDQLSYAIMAISDYILPEGFCEMQIPETSWAVFDCRGPVPQAIQEGWDYLRKEWLVKYPFQHASCPELEWYSDGNSYSSEYLSQIWIPIIIKED